MGLESLYSKEMEREELEHRLSQRVAQLLSFYGHEIPRKTLPFFYVLGLKGMVNARKRNCLFGAELKAKLMVEKK